MLAKLEASLTAGALGVYQDLYLHRATRETSLEWLHGRPSLVEETLADLSAWRGQRLKSCRITGDLVVSNIEAQTTSGGTTRWRRHRWVHREGSRIAAEILVCDEAARHANLDTVADLIARHRAAHPPLGELSSGLGQRGAVSLPPVRPVPPAPVLALIQAWHRTWNMRDLGGLSSTRAADVRWRGPAGRSGGTAEADAWLLSRLAPFPDTVWSLDRWQAEGNRIALLWRWHAHHVRPAFGLEPTGRRLSLIGSTELIVEDGRVVEEDTVLDELALLVQLRTQVMTL